MSTTDEGGARTLTLPAPASRVRSRLRSRLERIAGGGLGRIAGISASLVGTQALTSVLGLVFWTVAARTFTTTDVGVAGAAVALMLLLGSLGSLGLGTVLIARLPVVPAAERRVLARTCVAAAAAGGALLGCGVPLLLVRVLGISALAPIAGSFWPLVGITAATSLTAAVTVLDQAVLTIGLGTLQLERNVTASVVKLLVLIALAVVGFRGGMLIVLAWTAGNAASLPLVTWRTRGGRAGALGRAIVEPRLLRSIGRLAVSHHALNVSIQAALQLLPVLVTVLVSPAINARFNAALMVAGFVFALPYAVSIGLFAAARGDEAGIVSRMRFTIPFGLAVSAAADLVLFPLAGPVLHLFGSTYADGATLLRLIVLAGLPFVVKDHFIALRRVQNRTTQALAVMTVFLVLELAGAAVGAMQDGAVGLCIGWLGVLVVEALLLAVPLVRVARLARTSASVPAPATTTALVAEAPRPVTGSDSRARSAASVRLRGVLRRNLTGPVLLVMSLGVLVMAFAADLGRHGDTGAGAQALWVVGLVVIFVPAIARIVAPATPDIERTLLAVGLGVLLQVSRLVLNPTLFVFHDELIHADTLRQIDVSHRLFSTNPLLPVSGFYPGLEVVTNAVQDLTGLAAYPAAVVTLMLARVVLVLAILGLARALSAPSRVGALAVAVYAANPQFLFFNSQYSYQTLALPLAVLSLYFVAARRRGRRWSLVLPAASTAAVVVTHHLTAVLLVLAYLAWLLLVAIRGRRVPAGADAAEVLERRRSSTFDRIDLALLAAWGVLLSGLSILNPGNPILTYLGQIGGSSLTDLLDLSKGHQTKALFADTAGTGPAPWEQVLLIAAVLVAMATLLPALIEARRGWRAARPFALLFTAIALIYPVVPAGHLTAATAEVGDRASGFVFLGTGLVIGAWWWARRRRAAPLLVLGATVLFLGDVVLGSGPTAEQLPGRYEISADARSVDAPNLAAADWLATGVPANSVVYGDRTSGGLAAAYGGQDTVLHVSSGIDASRLLLEPGFGSDDLALLRATRLDYLIVDQRLADGLPHQQFYIESGEYGSAGRRTPVPLSALTKFAAVPGVDRVYDDGSVVVYAVAGAR